MGVPKTFKNFAVGKRIFPRFFDMFACFYDRTELVMAKRKTSSGITKRVALYLPVSTTGRRRSIGVASSMRLPIAIAIVLAQHISGAHSASGRTSEATTSAGSPAEVFEMSSRRHPART
jgi:hypothetical protein